MKSKLFLFSIFFVIASISLGQQTTTWENWDWLIGTWIGEGSG